MDRQISNKLLWQTISLILAILLAGNYAFAQKTFTEESYKINGKEVKEYLIEKYKLRKDDLTSTLQQTPYGPSGKLHVNSFEMPFTPQNVVITDAGVQGRARAIAQAFLKEEAALLGITNMAEIRERRIDTTKGRDGDYTTVRYSRYIDDLELSGMYIWIDIGPDERVIGVNAELIPAPAELYGAVKKETITEDKVIKIIEQDVIFAGVDPKDIKILMTKKIAISSSPYVVWIANILVRKDGTWNWGYTINAFTGEVIKKGELQRSVR